MPGQTDLPDLDAAFASFKRERVAVRCATCKLEPALREWVDRKLTEGEALRPVVEFLAKRDITISVTALGNHRAHVDRR